MRKILGLLTVSTCLLAVTNKDRQKVEDRLTEASTVFSEVMSAPDKGIPTDLLNDAHCIVIVPGLKKGAFIVGGQYGKGFMNCRGAKAGWSAPAAVRMEGGSIGFQIGGSETDIVMLVMNDRGGERLMQSQFTLGGEGEVAAGPVGRQATAQTDAKFTAEILSWSRSRGVFAGISLKGATLRQDLDDNEAMYGRRLETKDVVTGTVNATTSGRRLIANLSKHSHRENL
ncbi:MAG: lipid-binding SYLF domain-containing protein [Bryobacteraceae bacterium]